MLVIYFVITVLIFSSNCYYTMSMVQKKKQTTTLHMKYNYNTDVLLTPTYNLFSIAVWLNQTVSSYPTFGYRIKAPHLQNPSVSQHLPTHLPGMNISVQSNWRCWVWDAGIQLFESRGSPTWEVKHIDIVILISKLIAHSFDSGGIFDHDGVACFDWDLALIGCIKCWKFH